MNSAVRQKKISQKEITTEERFAAEVQIRELKHNVDYSTKEFTIEVIVDKYMEGKEEDENEIFIPTYQRAFVWTDDRKSKFIESIILELPIPYIFIATLPKDILSDEGRAEIVDGSQRIRTLAAFLQDDLRLTGLNKLEKLNGFRFSDLEVSRQRKIKRQGIRVIELSDRATEQIRRDIFERINTGSDELRAMEKRKGIYTGPFYDFIRECASLPAFKTVCPISNSRQRREEAEELVLRYFSYSDTYQSFRHDVRNFLDNYLKTHQQEFERDRMLSQFLKMIQFAYSHFPYGFRKSKDSSSVARVRFEALACGITLAQRINPDLNPSKDSIERWIDSDEFRAQVVSDASNSLPRLKGRIEYVRDRLLEA
ncbi:DUF262 domain-containing protein [Nitrosovibrio tenuis]|uniref:GmrSD restriction endonucleases N-terminal domain-containing protein n=1 Tax=Nitrosovibrio tenuis TaxID=1233 RepID=A0A1H7LMP3_9PROT|nr:DUF262 domain-containing protein [Nitrosovibrio tenuis]SEK99998.1 Protein of unknown function DUF262 [Nitrosovibrio tenuis]